MRANSQGGGGTGTRDQTLGGSCRSLRFFFGLLYYPMSDASKPCLKLYSVAPDNAIASISASPSNSATQANPQGTEYAAILDLSATSSAPLTWEQRMKERGSTTYEGLKTAIQGIYDCSAIFPPLLATAGVLLTISKLVDVRGSMCSTCKYVINSSASFSK